MSFNFKKFNPENVKINFYKVLRVARDASAEMIRKAYRRLVLKWHPDKCSDPQAAEKTKEIIKAYVTLSDPVKKEEYDRFDGLMRDDDSEQDGPTKFWRPGQRRFFFSKKNSFYMEFLPVSLEEILHGCTKTVVVKREFINSDGSTKEENKTFIIEVKPGCEDFKKFTFHKAGCMPSDIVFVIDYEVHTKFTWEGSDIFYVQKISLRDALCGVSVMIPTLDGRAVPFETDNVVKPFSHFRIIGFGLPDSRGKRGNLFIEFDVKFPTHLTASQKKKIMKLWPDYEFVSTRKSGRNFFKHQKKDVDDDEKYLSAYLEKVFPKGRSFSGGGCGCCQRPGSSNSYFDFERFFRSDDGECGGISISRHLSVSLEDILHGCTKKTEFKGEIVGVDGSIRKKEKIFTVEIVPGCEEGKFFRFPNYEGLRMECGCFVPNEFVIMIVYEPHPKFTVEGRDLHYVHEISLKWALCGVSAKIPTLDGHNVRFSTDKVVTPTTEHRFVGLGIPDPKAGGKRGDLILEFDVQFPRFLSAEAKKVIKKLLPSQTFD